MATVDKTVIKKKIHAISEDTWAKRRRYSARARARDV